MAVGSHMDSARQPSRAALAVAMALLLHFLAAIALWLALDGRIVPQPETRRVEEPEAIEITVDEPGAPAVNEPPTTTEPRPVARSRAAVRSSSPQPPVAVPPLPPTEAPAAAPSQPPAIDLSFQALAGDAQGRALGSSIGNTDAADVVEPEKPRRRRMTVTELRAESERTADAEANVREGRVHPVLYEVLRGARQRLEPEALKLAEALPLGASQTMQSWGRGYLERVRQAQARDDEGSDRADRVGHAPARDRHPDLAEAYSASEKAAAAGAEQRMAEVCLAVGPGDAVAVTLRRTSHHAELDRLVIESFQGAGSARPMPPEVRRGQACYRVRIAAYRAPPVPSLSFGWKKGRPEVIYPLKRITKLSVELRSVDDGTATSHSGLLRAR